MVIAFCTSCMDRLWQLRQTLPHNLAVLGADEAHFIALCNYNSRDGLDEFVRSSFGEECRQGRLRYFHTRTPQHFHASKAKNCAHRLALREGADVLFNLDADNFITAACVRRVAAIFSGDHRSVLHHWSRKLNDGTFGRIAMSAASWSALGGYDETLREMAWQDVDLLLRARAIGLRYVADREGLLPAVQNSLADKFAHLGLPEVDGAEALQRLQLFNVENMMRSLSRPIAWPVAEQGRLSGRLNFGEAVEL
jgi:hypothetical protein